MDDRYILDKLKAEPMTTPREVMNYIFKNANHGGCCFIKYLQWWHNKLIIRTFGYTYRKRSASKYLHTEVERAVVGMEYAVRKNLYKTQMGGYHAAFSENQKSSTNYYGYTYYYFSPDDFNVWYTEKAAGMYSPVINIDYLYTLKKYKYCGYSGKQDLKEYLEAYDKNPMVEYFGKAGLKYTAMLGKKAKKDKQFAKFIVQHAYSVNVYGYKITVYAYEHKCSFKDAEEVIRARQDADSFFKGSMGVNYKVDRVKLHEYAKLNCGKYRTGLYIDYWNACVQLGYDMRDTKNSMPSDFHRMHEVRTAEYASYKAKLNRKAAAELNKKIKATASKYMFDFSNEKYTIVLPQTKNDFEREGEALHHCVARMGYDLKMANGQIIIAFVRMVEDPKQHYVTVEYNLDEKRIMQMHGKDNCTPDKETRAFIEKWAKKVKEVQKLEAI